MGKVSSEISVCKRVHLDLEIWILFGFRKWKAGVGEGAIKHPLIEEGAFEVEFNVLFIGVGRFNVE
jgi:hypothetical protein